MENKFKFLTKYSLNKKLKNKWFLVANIVVFLIIVALVNIDSIISFFGGDFNNDINIKIAGNTTYYEVIKKDLDGFKNYLSDVTVNIKKEDKSIDKLKKELKDTKDILLIINNDSDNVFNVEFITDSYIDMVRYQVIVNCLNNSKSKIALLNSNIDQKELDKINKSVDITRTFIDKEKTKDEENSKSILSILSMILVLPCFMLIVFLTQMIGAEVNEEKSTRGMEIIIGNVSAKTHFFSKILSSNLFVIIQGLLLIFYSAFGLIVRKLISKGSSIISSVSQNSDISSVVNMVKESNIINKLGYIIPLIIILIILSFLAYSLLAGILSSMTTNMENYQQLQTPLMVISVIGYYLILLSSMFPGALFIKIASVVPLISISLAPSLLLSGEIGVSLIIIAILLLLILDYILIKYGLKIYKVGILNYSETNLWKKIFKAIKE